MRSPARRGLDVIFSLVVSTPAAVPVAVEGMIRSRALVLDEIAARRSAPGATDDGGAEFERRMSAAQQRFANLLVRGPSTMTASTLHRPGRPRPRGKRSGRAGAGGGERRVPRRTQPHPGRSRAGAGSIARRRRAAVVRALRPDAPLVDTRCTAPRRPSRARPVLCRRIWRSCCARGNLLSPCRSGPCKQSIPWSRSGAPTLPAP